MAYTSRIEWENLRSFNSTGLTGTYQALGTPLLHPCFKLKIVNNSNVLITISDDGVNDKDVVPGNSFVLYDETISASTGYIPALQQGTQIYVKGSAGTGLIYLVSQYIINH
jgi:hypothetical protein